MREIKFRGKSTKTGEWVYGYYVFCRRHNYILPIYDPDDKNPCFDERWIQAGADDDGWIEVDPETVGQYTGKHDKDGKEIYGGDIEYWPDDTPGVWSDQAGKKQVVEYPFVCGNADKGKIIGNIHTTPELLKAKE